MDGTADYKYDDEYDYSDYYTQEEETLVSEDDPTGVKEGTSSFQVPEVRAGGASSERRGWNARSERRGLGARSERRGVNSKECSDDAA